MKTDVVCFLEFFICVYDCTMLYIVSFLFSYLHCLIMSRSFPILTTLPPCCLGVNKNLCAIARGWSKYFGKCRGASSDKCTFPVSLVANAPCIVSCPETGKNLVSNIWGPGLDQGKN